MKTIGFLAAVAVLSFAFVSDARSQIDVRGQITGKVTDESGYGVKRVYVRAMNLTTLEVSSAITNDFGRFTVDDLQFGNIFLISVSSSRYYFASPFQTVNLDSISKRVLFVASDFPVSLPKAP